MSYGDEPIPARALCERRVKLFELLPEGSKVLLFNGGRQYRNYPTSPYPFRGNSHFLYFFGRCAPGSIALMRKDDSVLFVPVSDDFDELWEGKRVTPAEWRERTGADQVASLGTLKDVVPRDVLSLPIFELSAKADQREILGRVVTCDGPDRAVVDAVVELRLCHDQFALRELRTAARETAVIHESLRAEIGAGVSEQGLAARLHFECNRRGLSPSFAPIVTTRGEVLHTGPTHRSVENGDLVLVDFGIETHEGYAGDMTRTWPIGEPSELQRHLLEVVVRAHDAAAGLVRPGVRFREVHDAAARSIAAGLIEASLLQGSVDEVVERGAHALFFPHGVGHLVGLDVHDMEDLGDIAGYGPGITRSEQFGLSYLRLDRVLRENMVVTIEPGIYASPVLLQQGALKDQFKDLLPSDVWERMKYLGGIRYENEVLVTQKGCELLTIV